MSKRPLTGPLTDAELQRGSRLSTMAAKKVVFRDRRPEEMKIAFF